MSIWEGYMLAEKLFGLDAGKEYPTLTKILDKICEEGIGALVDAGNMQQGFVIYPDTKDCICGGLEIIGFLPNEPGKEKKLTLKVAYGGKKLAGDSGDTVELHESPGGQLLCQVVAADMGKIAAILADKYGIVLHHQMSIPKTIKGYPQCKDMVKCGYFVT